MDTLPLICIIDDTDDFRFLIEKVFQEYLPAYSLQSFDNGQSFLNALPKLSKRPSLLLLDQHMPQLNGYQTLVILKKREKYRSIPVVMISADASQSEIASFYQAGAATFFRKPMDFDSLKEIVLNACQYASNCA